MADDRQFLQKQSTKSRRDKDYPADTLLDPQLRKKRSRPITEDEFLAEDDSYAARAQRPGSSAIRLDKQPAGQRAISTQVHQNAPVPYRRATQSPVTTTGDAGPAARSRNTAIRQSPLYAPPAPPKEHRRVHLLLPIGIGMLAMLALWVFGSLVLAWGLARYDDVRYGNPRTYQTNAVVGHGNDNTLHPTHFIAINLNRHIVVYEIMASDPTRTITYGGPYLYGSGEDLTPPILEFRDVNADGKLDMLIHLGDQTVVFVNTGDRFRPSNANDNIHL